MCDDARELAINQWRGEEHHNGTARTVIAWHSKQKTKTQQDDEDAGRLHQVVQYFPFHDLFSQRVIVNMTVVSMRNTAAAAVVVLAMMGVIGRPSHHDSAGGSSCSPRMLVMVEGFLVSSSSSTSPRRRQQTSTAAHNNALVRVPVSATMSTRSCTPPRTTTALFGILDDMMSSSIDNNNGDAKKEEQSATISSTNKKHEELFHALIFSSNTRADIAKKLEACTEPDFIQYLTSSLDQSEDTDERQGLQELLYLIDDQHRQQQKAAEALKAVTDNTDTINNEEESSEAASSTQQQQQQPMSNADVLKRANEIDQALVAAAKSDDEKPSDFISDCREVVNLSRSFNNQGQMRVGGR